MTEQSRAEPLPLAMQGPWIDADDPAGTLVIDGAEVIYGGRPVAHDHKRVEWRDGALTVTLGIDDERHADSFQRESITGLVISPDGEFFAYSAKFASRFIRADP